MTRLGGRATAEGTRAFAARHPRAGAGHFRALGELTASSVGLGTYLGKADDTTDALVRDAAIASARGGVNVFDTAINYRCMRGERALGEALRTLVAGGELAREELIVATKGGFLPFDGVAPADPTAYVRERFLDNGLVRPDEIAAGCHCLSPRYLAAQLQESRQNLGLETIDLYYLHNPETQLEEVGAEVFRERLRAAFEVLEAAAEKGHLGCYGLATWSAFRVQPSERGYISLEEVVAIAREVAGLHHHLRVVQVPYNLAMPEAYVLANQAVLGDDLSLLEAAARLGLSVMASVPLYQTRLCKNLPPVIRSALALSSDPQRALQFVRSTPGLLTALAGMKAPEHVAENLRVVGVDLASEETIEGLFRRE